MNQQPNPALKNTAIYVGNDEELRKKAIEYYKSNGYELKYVTNGVDFNYIGTFIDCSKNIISDFIDANESRGYTIITLPTETETEYPKMMLVSHDEEEWFEKEVICEHLNGYVCFFTGKYVHFDFAKPLPTTTLTVAELVEFYEKSNNVKVEVKQNTTETTN